MYGFGGVCLSEVMLSISELNVVGMGGRDKRTSWSDLVGVRQKFNIKYEPNVSVTKILS